ncbi:DNRLRE domain-containing protein [Microtetraspora malaysiensis]|uniref:DNRLRE domain-containing protein n=1 Tax=Microtetraspora malaysiensis TaxID=161358 RepID=UPI003D8E39BA
MKRSPQGGSPPAGSGGPGVRRAAALVGVAALLVAVSLTGPAGRASTAADDSPASPRETAAQIAKARGTRVEVESEKTESSSLWANPNGTFTLETFPSAVRVKNGDTWRPIDTSLILDGDAGLRPKAAASDVRLSGGGGKPFAEVRRADHSFAVSWGKALPAPRVTGDTATYANVVPGGDLTVKALPNGFSHSIVLRERPAAPLEFTLPVSTKGLRLSKAGDHGLDLRDTARGDVLASAPAPRMWDSTMDQRSGEAVHQAAIATAVRQTDHGTVLVLKPDPAFLSDPAVKYPVTIDPTSTLTVETDTWVQSDIPDSQRGSTELKAGTYDGSHIARSYLKFRHVDDLRGTHILNTDLRLWTFWSSVCVDPSAGVQARRITSAWDPDTIRYGSEPATTTAGAVITKAAYGAASCPQNFMHWDTDAIVQAWADGQPNYGIQLRGADEKDASTWRRWYSSNYVSGAQGEKEPALSVTFEYKVPTPTALSAAPAASDAGSSGAVVSTTPTLTGKVGGATTALNYTFEVTRDGSGDVLASGTVGNVAAGTTAAWKVPAGKLLNARTYRYHVKAAGAAGASGWSAWRRFTTDAANTPTGLVTGLQEPANPVLSGIPTRASGHAVAARFYLFDAAGNPVGPVPLGMGAQPAGQRVALRVPDGLIEIGKAYKWQMDACADNVCSPRTALVGFTAPPPPAPPATTNVTIGHDKITTVGAKAGVTACGGSPCPVAAGTGGIALGGSGEEEQVVRVTLDLSAVPAGAVITSAVLSLGSPACQAACPPGAKVSAYAFEGAPPDQPTGADLVANALAEPVAEVPAASPGIDITGLVRGRDDSPGQGFLLRLTGDTSAEVRYGTTVPAAVKVDIAYVPPTGPAKVGSVTVRPGDGGVLASWAPQADLGADTDVDQYDVQVLDGSEQVVKSVTSQEISTVVKGLANGTAYHVQVRAKTAFGTSPWQSSAAVTPTAVPGGVQKYLDAVQQYHQNQQALVEGRYADVDTALAASTQGDLYASALRVSAAGLHDFGQALQARGLPRTSSTVTLSDTLVTYSAADNTVTVRTTVHTVSTSVQTDLQSGEEAPQPSEEVETTDYSFRANNLAINAQSRTDPTEDDGLTRVAQGGDVDVAAGAPVAANAVPTGEEPAAGDMPDLPRDGNGFPTETPGPTTAAAAKPLAAGDVSAQRASYNEVGAANWARRNVNIREDYRGHDCENFLSKAMHNGGGLGFIKGYSHGSDKDRRNWYGLYTLGWVSSRAWRLVDDLYWNMRYHRKRLGSWRQHDWDVRVGDLIFWRYKGHSGYYHITIVTQIVGRGAQRDIRYTGHSSKRKDFSVYEALAMNPNSVVGFIPVID